MLVEGSRAFAKRGWAPPFGWGRTTRLGDHAPERSRARDCDVTTWSGDHRSVCNEDPRASKARTVSPHASTVVPVGIRRKFPGNIPTIRISCSLMNGWSGCSPGTFAESRRARRWRRGERPYVPWMLWDPRYTQNGDRRTKSSHRSRGHVTAPEHDPPAGWCGPTQTGEPSLAWRMRGNLRQA